MAFKLKKKTKFPALVTVSSPLTLVKNGLSFLFGLDIDALRESLDDVYAPIHDADAGQVSSVAPQGRLTLATATPVMIANQAAVTTVYYTPYAGNQIPLYDGVAMVPTTFTELSVATTNTTKNPAAIGASKVNDWFIWSDAGTLRLCHGPDWTSDTARSAGTALEMVSGIFVNSVAITNGPSARLGTYVGTTRSNSSSSMDWIFGAVAAGGTAAIFGVWNAYNRVSISTFLGNSADTWTYNVATWRAVAGSSTMRASFVRGLQEEGCEATHMAIGQPGAGTNIAIGVGLDTTTGFSGSANSIGAGESIFKSVTAKYAGIPGIGYHYLSANEYQTTTTSSTWYGDGGSSYIQTGMTVNLRG